MEQYKLEYLLFADAANVDQFGKLNVLGVFQNINLVTIPGSLLRFFLVCSILINDPKKSFIVDIKIKDSKEVYIKLKRPIHISFHPQGNNKDNSVNLVVDMIGIQFTSYDKYEVEVFVNDNKIGSSLLNVIEKKTK